MKKHRKEGKKKGSKFEANGKTWKNSENQWFTVQSETPWCIKRG